MKLEDIYEEKRAEAQAEADQQKGPLGSERLKWYYRGMADAYASAAFTAKKERICSKLGHSVALLSKGGDV